MAESTSQQDAVKADPKHYSVVTEDDRVRVLKAVYGPGERSPMHSHPAIVAVFLTDGHVRFHYPDGKSDEVNGKAGQALTMPGTTHSPENLATTPFEVILVELKS